MVFLETGFGHQHFTQLRKQGKHGVGVLAVFDSSLWREWQSSCSSCKSSLVLDRFFGFGGKQPVERCVLREVILEGDDGRAVEDQTFTGIGVGHIVLLAGRDIQRSGEDFPVSRCLIQEVDKIAVLKNVLNLSGSQQVLDILRDTGGNPAPFTEPLPDFNTE